MEKVNGCLYSILFLVLQNRKVEKQMIASEGLEQGNALCPSLCTLVADILNRLILRMDDCKVFGGFRVGMKVACVSFAFHT